MTKSKKIIRKQGSSPIRSTQLTRIGKHVDTILNSFPKSTMFETSNIHLDHCSWTPKRSFPQILHNNRFTAICPTTKDRYCYNIWNEVLHKIEDNHHACCTQKSFSGWSFPEFDRLEEYRLLQNSTPKFAVINMSSLHLTAYLSSSFQNYSTASFLP